MCVSGGGGVISVKPDFSNGGFLIMVQDEEPQTSHCRVPGDMAGVDCLEVPSLAKQAWQLCVSSSLSWEMRGTLPDSFTRWEAWRRLERLVL